MIRGGEGERGGEERGEKEERKGGEMYTCTYTHNVTY